MNRKSPAKADLLPVLAGDFCMLHILPAGLPRASAPTGRLFLPAGRMHAMLLITTPVSIKSFLRGKDEGSPNNACVEKVSRSK